MDSMSRQSLGDMLLSANLIDEVQMQVALAEQRQSHKKFGSTLVDLKFIDENVLAAFLSKQMDVPCISLLNIDIPKRVLRRIPNRVARECHAVPVRIEDDHVEVAMVDPTDTDAIHLLETTMGLSVMPMIAPESSIEKMIDKHYPIDISPDDTQRTKPKATETNLIDPIFSDLIDEIQQDGVEERLDRIEDTLDQVWRLLERILRIIEPDAPARGRARTRK